MSWYKLNKQSRAAFVVDGSNVHATCRELGFSIDYDKLIKTFEGNVFRSCYFTALPPKEEQSTLRPMVDWLAYNGWHIHQKEWTEFVNDGVTKVKGNMDIEIAVIALELAPHISDLFLFSGDSDFSFLVEALQRHYGIRVTVVSSIETRPAMCGDKLRRQADEFIELNSIREFIQRAPRGLRRGTAVMGD